VVGSLGGKGYVLRRRLKVRIDWASRMLVVMNSRYAERMSYMGVQFISVSAMCVALRMTITNTEERPDPG